MEVDDASAQEIPLVDHRVRQEYLAAALQAIEQGAIQRIEVPLGVSAADLRSQVGRNVTKRRDAQVLGLQYQLRMRPHRVGHQLRQADVVTDHLPVAVGA